MKDRLLGGDPPHIHITHAKRQADRYVPILPEVADELRTHLQGRQKGFLFESNRHTCYSSRMVQSIVKDCALQAGIAKRVYPYLLRHSVATILLDSGQAFRRIQRRGRTRRHHLLAAKPNGLDSEIYLHHVLERIADHPITRIAELLPWNVTINTPTITPQA